MDNSTFEYKKNNIIIRKNQKNNISTSVPISFSYLKNIGINEDNKKVTIIKFNNYIIVAKSLDELKNTYVKINSILEKNIKIKTNNITFDKNSSDNISTKLPIPYSFLRDLGVDEQNRGVYIIKYDNYIIIAKDLSIINDFNIENKIKFHNNCEEFLNSILNSSLIELKSIAINQMKLLSEILDNFNKFNL